MSFKSCDGTLIPTITLFCNMKPVIYLDNNATTPIDPLVLEAMMPFLTHNYANANSTHQFGVDAYEAVKTARRQVADLIGAEVNEIIFTSGATEAINLAIKGVADSYSDKGKHIITVATEHNAVLDTCQFLETKGFEITYLPVNTDGLINLDDLLAALRPDTILVSVMYVNNETGVIQPIKEIAKLAHSVGALFMTDATQAVGKMPINIISDDIDLLSFSGHKFYAPKGIGGLFVKQRRPNKVKLPALIHGGGHERGLRSGTLNVPGIVALGKASELANKEMKTNEKKVRAIRDYFEAEVLKIEGTHINGNLEHRLHNVTNICFEGIDSEAMIMALNDCETNENPLVAVSNGSACTSLSIDPSHVLTAMGLDETTAFNCIRFSFGKFNFQKEINDVLYILNDKILQLRAMV